MKTYYWLMRREFWEHHAIFIAPLMTAVVILIAGFTGGIQASQNPSNSAEKLADVAHFLTSWFVLPFFIVNGFVAIFYLMDSFYGERKDRSVMFWRSLPVSDTATVAAKLSTGLVLAPLLAALIAALSMPLIAFCFRVHFAGQEFSALPLMWNPRYFFEAATLWGYVLVVGVLWFLPVAAWFLAVSAWAPKSPFLWGLVPPGALFALEKIVRGTSWIGDQIADRIAGWMPLAFDAGVMSPGGLKVTVDGTRRAIPTDLLSLINPSGLLSSPRLWIGLLVGALLVFVAIQGRRYRTEA
jgi:ABC-2 type transport system permease protein